MFWTHSFVLFIAMVVGLVMMIMRDQNSAEFGLWSGIFSLGIGGFIPNPKLGGDGGDNVQRHDVAVRQEQET